MAFRFQGVIPNAEIRRVRPSLRKKDGKPQRVLRVEDAEGNNLEVNCSDEQLFHDIDQLEKGDVVHLPVMAMATEQYSFVVLTACPEPVVEV